ncbi:MAG: hypothetical protein IKJ76_04240, partial [Fibrobacter sp.]|nr:hypothetical protein [Fibrobacter sp.]
VAVRLASVKMFFCHFIPLLQQKVYRFKSRSLKDFRYFGEHRKRYSPKLSHKFSKSGKFFKRFSLIFGEKRGFRGDLQFYGPKEGKNVHIFCWGVEYLKTPFLA